MENVTPEEKAKMAQSPNTSPLGKTVPGFVMTAPEMDVYDDVEDGKPIAKRDDTNPSGGDQQLVPAGGGRKNMANSVLALFKGDTMATMLDLSKVSIPKLVNVAIPGVCSKVHAFEATNALKGVLTQYGGGDTEVELFAFLTGVFQAFTTHSTSPQLNMSDDRECPIVISKARKKVALRDIRTALDNSLVSKGYVNASRSYGRLFSSVIIQLTANGNIEPNVKVNAAHGLPPQYFAYGADCIVVDARLWGYDATLANELAKMVAINKKGASSGGLHNMYESTSAAPQIFLNKQERK